MGNTDDALRKELEAVEQQIEATKKDMKEMLDLRNKDHADFVRALKMDADAVSLISEATVRLSKYYKENNIPVGLMQAPETSFSGANAHQSESGGIVAILDMIKEDLQKEMKEGKADEAKAQAEYEKQNGALQDSLDAQTETKVSLEETIAALEEKIADAEKFKNDRKDDLAAEE